MRNTCKYCGSRLYECTCGEELSMDVNFCFMCSTANPNKNVQNPQLIKGSDASFPMPKNCSDFTVKQELKQEQGGKEGK